MEEVDTIIVRQLKAIDCEIDEEKTGLKQLDMNEMINCASRCLHLIRNSARTDSNTNESYSSSYPTIDSNSNMATKYKVANELSSQIKALGYRVGSSSKSSIDDRSRLNNETSKVDGDLGYQTFLYGSHSEFRNLFLFLISNLPKDSNDGQEVSRLSYDQVLKDKIKRRIVSENLDIWLPPMVDDQPNQSRTSDCNLVSHKLWNQNWYQYSHSSDERKTIVTVDRLENKIDDSKQRSSEGLSEESKEESLESDLKSKEEKLRLKQKLISDKRTSLAELNQQLKHEQIGLIELKHADISIDSLEAAVGVLNQDLNTLKEKWSELETELNSEKDEIISAIKSKSSESDKMKEKITTVRNEISCNLMEIKDKESLLESLESSLPTKSVPTRKSYTKRILEIINNYKKQMIQTQSILMDIKGHQKEINNLNGKVSRSFAICDDMIFQSVTSKGNDYRNDGNEFHKKSYKLLANLHEMNDEIMEGLQSIGSIKRDILKTEQLIEKEESDKIDEKLDKITKDLTQIKTLNHELLTKINS